MSEIEKMMQNAEVKKLLYCDICKAPLCKDGYICSEGWGWWLSRLQQESEG